MAKKFGRKRLDWEKLVQHLYDSGVTQSFIFHTISLLILSLIVISPKEDSRKPIALSFVEESESNISEEAFILEVETPLLKEEKSIEDLTEESLNSISEIAKTDEKDTSLENLEIDFDDQLSINYTSEISTDDIMQVFISEKRVVKTNRQFRDNSNNTSQIVRSNPLDGLGLGPNLHGDQNNNQYTGVQELDRRLKEYGAKSGDIQISLSWNTIDDIDLHVQLLPIRSNINWMQKIGHCGGILDIDMNAHPSMVTNRPIENVFWPKGGAPKGIYIVGIHNYRAWSGAPRTEVLLTVRKNGEIIFSKTGWSVFGEPIQEATRFEY